MIKKTKDYGNLSSSLEEVFFMYYSNNQKEIDKYERKCKIEKIKLRIDKNIYTIRVAIQDSIETFMLLFQRRKR